MIVENDRIQSADLENQLQKLEYSVVGTANTGQLAIDLAEEKSPDVVIMDIELDGNMDGIESANRIYDSQGIPIIYLSHIENVMTYRNARRNIRAEYVTKPLSIINVLNAIENLLFRPSADDGALPKINDRIFVKNGNGHYAVFLKDIIYIEANREVSVIHHTTSDKPSTVSVNLGALEDKLKPFNYLARCSRFHMVNLSKVTRIKDQMVTSPVTGKNAMKRVLELGDETIVISDKFKSQITARFHMH